MLKDIKQIDKFKAYYSGGIDDSGDFSVLNVTINKELQKALKDIVVKNTTQKDKIFIGTSEDGTNQYFEFKRYLVKSVFYSSLSSRDKPALFIKELIDKGKITFKFMNFPRRNEFKTNFEECLNIIMRTLLNCDFEYTAVFRVTPKEV